MYSLQTDRRLVKSLYQLYKPDFDMFGYSPQIYITIAKETQQTDGKESDNGNIEDEYSQDQEDQEDKKEDYTEDIDIKN